MAWPAMGHGGLPFGPLWEGSEQAEPQGADWRRNSSTSGPQEEEEDLVALRHHGPHCLPAAGSQGQPKVDGLEANLEYADLLPGGQNLWMCWLSRAAAPAAWLARACLTRRGHGHVPPTSGRSDGKTDWRPCLDTGARMEEEVAGIFPGTFRKLLHTRTCLLQGALQRAAEGDPPILVPTEDHCPRCSSRLGIGACSRHSARMLGWSWVFTKQLKGLFLGICDVGDGILKVIFCTPVSHYLHYFT